MVEHSVANLSRQLRRRAVGFVSAKSPGREPLARALRKIRRLGNGAVLFGGALRDLMLHGPGHIPRDVDIVVAELTPDLLAYLRPYIRRRTRFGGIEACIGGWDLDLWALSDTWAFRQGLAPCGGFRDLPKTTFLNVQAVVAEIPPAGRQSAGLVEHGFFRAIRQRVLDINLESNPFPARCALAALTTAHRLGFAHDAQARQIRSSPCRRNRGPGPGRRKL